MSHQPHHQNHPQTKKPAYPKKDTPKGATMSTKTGIQQITGATSVIVPPDAKSFTLVVIAGTINVTFTGTDCIGTAIPVPAGMSLSWSVDSEGQNIRCEATFTGTDGTANARITTTTF